MENPCNNSSEPIMQNLNPQMDSSENDQTTGLAKADMLSKRSEAHEEPEDDLRTANKRLKFAAHSGCGTGEQCVELIVEGYNSIAISKQTLRDASPYFATLLKYNEDRIHMTPPANVHLDSYVAVLHSVSNNQPPAVDESNMWDFLLLARYFLMKPLDDSCCRVLPTLTMDELCRLWRNAHAEQYQHVEKWFLAGIVRNMDQASQSVEFLDLGVQELMAVLSDEEFLPLLEEDVYKAIISWCEHIPAERMTRDILDVLLAEIVWDHYDSATIRQMTSAAPPPLQSALEDIASNAADRKKPKRAVERHLIFGHEVIVQSKHGNRRTREFLHYDCHRGILCAWNAPTARTLCTKGSWRYAAHNLKVGSPTVIFIKDSNYRGPGMEDVAIVHLVNGGGRVIGNGLGPAYRMEMVMGGYCGWLKWCYQELVGFLGFDLDLSRWRWEPKPAPFQCEMLEGVSSCLLELPEGEGIAHLLSFTRRDESHKSVPESVIGFHDRRKDFFSDFVLLPGLPAPRIGAAIVQCGAFLFVTGGSDMTDDNRDLAKRCYRLDLTTRDRWERIGDLSVPRTDHCMFVKSGRVFVYGGSTLEADEKVALMSFETYDPYAALWTAFSIPVTGGMGSFGNRPQTTYCVDMGSALDEAQYRNLVERIY